MNKDPEEILPFCTRCTGVGISYSKNPNSNFCHQCGSGGTCVPMERQYIYYLRENIDYRVEDARKWSERHHE